MQLRLLGDEGPKEGTQALTPVHTQGQAQLGGHFPHDASVRQSASEALQQEPSDMQGTGCSHMVIL